MLNQEHERDQTHSYWYIPSAPRVNYSLLVMESTGMMKLAIDDGSPLRQGAGTGSRLVFGGYRGLRRRNSRSRFLSGSLGIYRRFGVEDKLAGPIGSPRGIGARPGGGGGVGAPPPSWAPRASPPVDFCSNIFYIFQKNSLLIFIAFRELLFLHKKQHHGSSAENNVSQV